jgi:GNAT superfamily N-acetyltransferase
MLDDAAALIAKGLVHVLAHNGEVKGVQVLIPGECSMLQDAIAVSPDAQGLGPGRRMLEGCHHV